MNQQRNQMYIRFGQGRQTGSGGPGGPGGNWLSRILSVLVLLVLVGLAVTFGVFVLIIGAVLMIPVLWRQRHAIKQFWQLRKQAKAQFEESKRQHKQRQEQQHNQADSSVIDGEYEEVDKDDDRRS